MTTTHPPAPRPLLATGVAAGSAGLLCTLVGTWLDTPFRDHGSQEWNLNPRHTSLSEVLLLVALAAGGAIITFAGVVARARRSEPRAAATTALILGAASAVSLLIFWSGLPCILAAGTAVLAFDARRRLGRMPTTAAMAIILAVLAVIGALLLVFTG